VSNDNTPTPPDGGNTPAPLDGDHRMAAAIHLTGLINLFIWPVGALVQLVLWVMSGKTDKLADVHGRAAVNFNLSVLIYGLVGLLLTFLTAGLFGFVFIPLMLLLALITIWGAIAGTIAAKKGEPYKYPLAITLV
jgi:uncharacterized Tic20 family protein